jgi:hypothetical protein
MIARRVNAVSGAEAVARRITEAVAMKGRGETVT